MATATKKARAPRKISGGGGRSTDLQFLVFEDNNGDHNWAIVTSSGEQLAQSPSFASYEDAQAAARRIHDGAGSARFERHEMAALPIDLDTRRGAASRDDFDAERWLDEGGAHSAAVAVDLPAPR
jgi:uncharacterized protein YegP (UPF0339 family)